MSNGKIGIFLPGQHGDMAYATSVLKYKDIMWPDKNIVWFCSKLPNRPCIDILKFNDAISEIRHWPEGYELPGRCVTDSPLAISKGDPAWEDFSILKTADNRLHQEHKYKFESTKDLDEGYFPAAWMMPNRGDLPYANIAKKIFEVPLDYPWHPYLCFSNEERQKAYEFVDVLPYEKTIMMETFMGSHDVRWTDDMTRNTMRLCRNKFGKCNFIFASATVDHSKFMDEGVVSANDFTVRQAALLANHCDLFIGVCSGISVTISCWGNKPIPRIEWCSNPIISMASIANGPIERIVFDNIPAHISRQQLELKTIEVLNLI
jgi:hypothetical protein